MSISPGLRASLLHSVKQRDTALLWGSEMPVLSSPTLIGLFEQACVQATDHLLPRNQTTVGIGFDLRHVAPSPIGTSLKLEACLRRVDGSRLTFQVEARDSAERVSSGELCRAIVDKNTFLSLVEGKRKTVRNTVSPQAWQDIQRGFAHA